MSAHDMGSYWDNGPMSDTIDGMTSMNGRARILAVMRQQIRLGFENRETWQEAYIAALKRVNGCEAEGKPWAQGCTRYESKTQTPLVTFIHPGGHAMPKESGELIGKFFKECKPAAAEKKDTQ